MQSRVVVVFFWMFCCTLFGASASRIPVVLSTDVGNEVDDQWAIVYLLTNPTFDVRGLMSAHAPSIRPPAGRTGYLLLRQIVEQRMQMGTHPPLIEGASEPLADKLTPRPSPAVDFLLKTSKEFDPDNRLTVLTIGAVTDLASAILRDPSISHRINVIDMGFRNWPQGGDEFNIANDVRAMQVVLDSDVPLVVGSADVCRRDLAVSFDRAREMVGKRGPIGQWLWNEYQAWYYRFVKPLRKDDFSKPWIIWDNVVLAYLLGQTTQETYARPKLRDDMTFEQVTTDRKITWITKIDTENFWAGFLEKLDAYETTHALPLEARPGHLSFLLP